MPSDRADAPKPSARQRAAALVAVVLAPAVVLLAVFVVVQQFPRGLIVLACVTIALAAGWYGLLRRGAARLLGLGIAAAALILPAALLVTDGDHLAEAILIPVGFILCLGAARAAFRVKVSLPPAPRPLRPVLFYNPKSGGGKAERFALAKRGAIARHRADRADSRGGPGGAGARRGRRRGGRPGDGRRRRLAGDRGGGRRRADLPYACIPAGTRNHFALDLGVDRDDVVGALDAFVDGGERRVDLAEVNGRVFVNNVSLGLYAEAVQRDGLPGGEAPHDPRHGAGHARPRGCGLDLRWTGPGGHEHQSGRGDPGLQQPLPAREGGRLGHPAADRRRPARDHGRSAPAGAEAGAARAASVARMDGAGVRGRPERPGSRRHRRRGRDPGGAAAVPDPARRPARPDRRAHPGASPSAAMPDNVWKGLAALVGIAGGRAQVPG